MTNPAAELLDIFRLWAEGNANMNAATLRNLSDPYGGDGMRSQMRAVKCLERIDQVLNDLERRGRSVRATREYWPEWQAAVFAFPHGWTQANGKVFFNRHMMNQLEATADTINDWSPAPSDKAKENLRSSLGQIAEAMTSDQSLPEELKGYMAKIMRHIQSILDDFAVYGRFDLEEALEQMQVALWAAEGASEDPTLWERIRHGWLKPVTIGVLGGVPAMIQNAIGMG